MVRLTGFRVVGVVASLALAFALLIGYAPGVLPTQLQTTLDRITQTANVREVMLFAGVLVAIVGLLSSWVWRTDERAGDWTDDDVESPLREVSVAGATLSDDVDAWAESGNPLTAAEREPLSDSLREILADAIASPGHGTTTSDVIEAGTWTDDRLAAAFLATSDRVDYPLVHRLYAWLYPKSAYERRARRALRAVEGVCAQRYSGYEPPDRAGRDRIASLRRSIAGGDDE